MKASQRPSDSTQQRRLGSSSVQCQASGGGQRRAGERAAPTGGAERIGGVVRGRRAAGARGPRGSGTRQSRSCERGGPGGGLNIGAGAKQSPSHISSTPVTGGGGGVRRQHGPGLRPHPVWDPLAITHTLVPRVWAADRRRGARPGAGAAPGQADGGGRAAGTGARAWRAQFGLVSSQASTTCQLGRLPGRVRWQRAAACRCTGACVRAGCARQEPAQRSGSGAAAAAAEPGSDIHSRQEVRHGAVLGRWAPTPALGFG